MILQVESRPGMHGGREPVAFHLGGRRVGVLQVIDRWLSEDCSYFKVEADDSSTCILRHFHAKHEWELTLYQSSHMQSDDHSRN
ncbi:MAG TPA: hypothetical protein VEB70_05325 [Noviherbaspirillum sp.]|nr:hypothetical protein [Noviherbaspirillum sp.]